MMTPAELSLLLKKCALAATHTPKVVDPACPAMSPPPGELPLDPNAPSLWSSSVGVTVLCFALAALFMGLRIFTRTLIMKRKFALEDALLIFATIALISMVGLEVKAYHALGGPKHQWDVTIGELMAAYRQFDSKQYVWPVELIHISIMYTAKLSILLQIKHMFEGTQRLRMFVTSASWATIVAKSCAFAASFLMQLFACRPIYASWDPSAVSDGRCAHYPYYVSCYVNFATDIAILILPITGVAPLQMVTRKKAAVSGVFAMGLVVSAMTSLRYYYHSRQRRSRDQTYWLTLEALSATAKAATVIMCGCLITFPRFIKWASESRKTRKQNQSYGMRGYPLGSRSGLSSNAGLEPRKIDETNGTQIIGRPVEDWDTNLTKG